MKHSLKTRALSLLLAAVMVVGMCPLAMPATPAYAVESKSAGVNLPTGMDVISDKESTLAPGVTLNEVTLYDVKGDRVEMYVTTVDTTVDTVAVYANYKDNQNTSYGLQTLSEQVAAIEANYDEPFKVVAGINASYYNTSSGKPTGAFVMEGIDVTTESEGNKYSFFAVLNDGTYMIGAVNDYSKYKGQIKEAIGGYQHIVKNGAVASGLDKTTKYPRQTLGLTADNKLILMTADGSQAPQTVGLTIQEQAEVMLAMGCVEAIHLDGGNSATFGTVPEGSDKFVLTNSPSGGAERAVSNTLMIVSTAVADGTFHHAVVNCEYDYMVPTASCTFSAIGVDATNGVAEIPENAVWTLSDDSFGVVDSNGLFVSNGKLGSVDVQLTVDGKVVGSKTIGVITPTKISFDGTEATVPYGKSAALEITAMYGNNEAKCEADDFEWTISPAEAGTMEGFTFYAAETDLSIATVTASYKHDASVANTSIEVKFGKGSEVLFDFEDGDISDWRGTETINEWIDEKNAANPGAKYPIFKPENYSNSIDTQSSSVFLASEENGGKVKSGEYSLGFRLNHLNTSDPGGWLYNYLYYTGETKVLRDLENGVAGIRIGMWVYNPDVTNVAFRIVRGRTNAEGVQSITYGYMSSGYDGAKVSYATNYGVPESGWMYIYYDLTDLADSIRQTTSMYDPVNKNNTNENGNYYPAFLQLFTGSAKDTMEEIIFYIDDITLDYSAVTDDRDAPIISNMTVSTDGSNDVPLNGQTVDSNLLSFGASVADKTGNSNMTGLDYTTAKIYVDGIDMSGNAAFKAGNGKMTLNNVNLTNGKHSIAFVICDKQGNETRMTKTLTVNGPAANAVVSVSGRNDGNNVPEAGSIYYIDVKASDASQIEAVTTTLKLNSANRFEYENIICADGVTATATYDALDFELTVTLSHDGSLSGETTLASIPVRVWAWDEEATGVTAEKRFDSSIPVIDIEAKTTLGQVTYADSAFANYISGFYGEMDVATKLDNESAWHKHTAAEINQDADCTHNGYTGRTYCDVCKSIVEWGTTVPATGHNYELGDDQVLDCACGETFTGVWEDGKTYEDGICMADGWNGESYYKDGIKVTGVQCVAAPDGSGEFYYDFGENGVCAGKAKYNGLFFDASNNTYRYAKMGVLTGGWFTIDGEWYYFEETTMNAATGTYQYTDDIVYEFADNGRLTSGFWAKTLYGYRYYYGPGYYKTGWHTIDGKDYCFDNGYRVEGGYQCVFENQVNANWYYFKEDGSCDRDAVIPDGFYTDRNGTGYSVNGSSLQGIHNIDGTYYYFNTKGYAQTGSYGGYLFGDDYKGFTGLVEKKGNLYYYENGKPCVAGLVEVDGAYYFAKGSNGQVAMSETCYVWQGNGIIPESTREFGADGKMLDGIIEKNGTLYYYNMGQAAAFGLVEVDGAYYFAKGNKGEIAVSETCYVWNGNGIIPESTCEFGADGKMLNGIVERNGSYFYYEMGQPKMAGLIEIDGSYYFAKNGKGELVTNQTYYVWMANDLMPEGNYQFDEQGKMRNGIVEVNGTLYYYEGGRPKLAGLVEVDGAYYFANGSNGEIAVGKTCYVWQGNGIVPESTREFGADGKMLDGIVEKDDRLYYYIMGQPKLAGLVEVDGAYYFANGSRGEIAVSETCYVWQGNGIIPESTREFGADGKMLDGIVEKDGTLYYYVMGLPKTAGLIEIDGAYYFAKGAKGEIAVSETCYVWNGNGIIPESTREFGADGKMLDGFITREDGIYYYENGKTGPIGLNYIDGYYYFVGVDGKLVTSRSYYVWQTNGLCIAMTYTFDAMGRAVI